jgi:quinol-cytochrome oxidoreductase complex cytochrome b subunit
MSRILKRNVILKLFNNFAYDSLLPSNLNYFYNFGSLLAIVLVIQILSGFFLASYYVAETSLAFDSIEYIMREVPYGYMIRYIHANGAAMFFIFVYIHIARALIYGSYTKHRMGTWYFGVIILFLMIITAFLGYSLVYGQMSYWAKILAKIVLYKD